MRLELLPLLALAAAAAVLSLVSYRLGQRNMRRRLEARLRRAGSFISSAEL